MADLRNGEPPEWRTQIDTTQSTSTRVQCLLKDTRSLLNTCNINHNNLHCCNRSSWKAVFVAAWLVAVKRPKTLTELDIGLVVLNSQKNDWMDEIA